ncbi:hypothetical protein Hte_001142 [Hypoxylon texense]
MASGNPDKKQQSTENTGNISTAEDDQGSEATPSSQADTSSSQPSKRHLESPMPEEKEDTGLLPKWMLPQNDPAYTELLNRDHSDLVSRAEAMAIFRKQPPRTYSKEEMRARYSAFFPVRDMMAAWKRGDMDYDPWQGTDPWATNKKTDEKGKGDGKE